MFPSVESKLGPEHVRIDYVFWLILEGIAPTYQELAEHFHLGDNYLPLDICITDLCAKGLIDYDPKVSKYVATNSNDENDTSHENVIHGENAIVNGDVITNVIKPTESVSMSTENALLVKPLFVIPTSDREVHSYFDVLVVMPFRNKLQDFYENCLKKNVVQFHLSVGRADDLFASRSIMDDIWKAIFFSKFIIADCSYKNPNVFYEIGIAHTLGKPVLLLSQNKDDIPFDLRHLRHIFYDLENVQDSSFKSKLNLAIEELYHRI